MAKIVVSLKILKIVGASLVWSMSLIIQIIEFFFTRRTISSRVVTYTWLTKRICFGIPEDSCISINLCENFDNFFEIFSLVCMRSLFWASILSHVFILSALSFFWLVPMMYYIRGSFSAIILIIMIASSILLVISEPIAVASSNNFGCFRSTFRNMHILLKSSKYWFWHLFLINLYRFQTSHNVLTAPFKKD